MVKVKANGGERNSVHYVVYLVKLMHSYEKKCKRMYNYEVQLLFVVHCEPQNVNN